MGYEDKSQDVIIKDLHKEFYKIDKVWYRDDQEIFTAWQHLVDRYIWEIKKDPKMNYWPWALEPLKKYKLELQKRFNECKWLKLFTGNKDLLEKISKELDAAENETLKRLWINSVTKEHVQQKRKVDKAVWWKVFDIDKKNWDFILTEKVNPLKIHDVLKHVCKNKAVYKIDYSDCKNPKIKDKMTGMIWWNSCWISYNEASHTYLLSDKNWNVLSDRALIWEWVRLKEDKMMAAQLKDKWGLSVRDQEALDNLRSTSKPFNFDANNYRYYEQYSAAHGNICAAYAYWCLSDILSKQWRCFLSPEVSAWEIANSRYIKKDFNVDEINANNPQQQIVNAPAGTLLTVRYNKTRARPTWVSHVMISLWNWVYTDLFWPHIRKIDFKSQTKFNWKSFTYAWHSYSLSWDSRLISPKLWNFPVWKEGEHVWENLTPEEFAKQIHRDTWMNMNYIRSLIVRQNHLTASNFWTKYPKLSIRIISKEITDLKLDNKEWSSDVAREFLNSIKLNKPRIMDLYPQLSNHEYDEIAKRALWILYQESDGWKSFKYFLKEGILHMWNWMFSSLFSDSWSRWFTQIKFDMNVWAESKLRSNLISFWIYGENDLKDAGKCWIATMMILIENYRNIIQPKLLDPMWNSDHPYDRKWNPVDRPPMTKENCFDYLYYTWNRPSEIARWTATPQTNRYIAQANRYVSQHAA